MSNGEITGAGFLLHWECAAPKVVDECGKYKKTLDATAGWISSKSPYRKNTDCSWIIGRVRIVKFPFFFLRFKVI